MDRKYSGKDIIRAGECLLDDNLIENSKAYSEATEILSFWRFCHENSLNNAFLKIQTLALKHDDKAIFAKRLKRYVSIVKKLKRFREMKLKNMQDIGGCRIILSNEKMLRRVIKDLKKEKEFKNGGRYRVKDYIKTPKEDGYRSYHIVGRFLNSDNKEMNIEIQLRTQIQHYWATALEIVDLFTDQALKSNLGNKDWKGFFTNISIQFSKIEKIHSFRFLSPKDQQREYKKLLSDADFLKAHELTQKFSRKLKVKERFEVFYASLEVIDSELELGAINGYVLLEINVVESILTFTVFSDNETKEAEQAYIQLEKELDKNKQGIVALVSTTAVGDIKSVYPNFFADSTQFRRLLELIESIQTKPLTPIFSYFTGLNLITEVG